VLANEKYSSAKKMKINLGLLGSHFNFNLNLQLLNKDNFHSVIKTVFLQKALHLQGRNTKTGNN